MLQFLKLQALYHLENVLDRDRDHLSYYRLDAVREWLERRTKEDGAKDVTELKDALTYVVEAQKSLENMADTLVTGHREIKAETTILINKTVESVERTRVAAEKFVNATKDNRDVLITKTQGAENTLNDAVKRWSHE